MARHVRKPLLAIVPIALVVVLVIVLLSDAPTHRSAGPGCNNPADSALNQYCDAIPAGTGVQTPKAGEPALALRLPRRLLSRIQHSGRRALLSLPAPGAAHSLRASRTTQEASVSALSWPMIAVLIVLAAILAGGAFAVRWRRRRLGG